MTKKRLIETCEDPKNPKIGDLIRGNKIGKYHSLMYIWRMCDYVGCGKYAWVAFRRGQPDSRKCPSCCQKKPLVKSLDGRLGWKCSKCKEILPISEFYAKHSCWCKKCELELAKTQRKKDNLRYRERDKFYRRKYQKANPALYRVRIILNSARTRARNKGLSFDIDIDWTMRRLDELGWRSEIRTSKHKGTPFHFGRKNGRQQPNSLSCDQKRPGGGYTKDNVRFITWLENKTKSNLSLEQISNLFQIMGEWAQNEQKGEMCGTCRTKRV